MQKTKKNKNYFIYFNLFRFMHSGSAGMPTRYAKMPWLEPWVRGIVTQTTLGSQQFCQDFQAK
jgi:hypothetical protein